MKYAAAELLLIVQHNQIALSDTAHLKKLSKHASLFGMSYDQLMELVHPANDSNMYNFLITVGHIPPSRNYEPSGCDLRRKKDKY